MPAMSSAFLYVIVMFAIIPSGVTGLAVVAMGPVCLRQIIQLGPGWGAAKIRTLSTWLPT